MLLERNEGLLERSLVSGITGLNLLLFLRYLIVLLYPHMIRHIKQKIIYLITYIFFWKY